jgi:FixJ family two-component response regulator
VRRGPKRHPKKYGSKCQPKRRGPKRHPKISVRSLATTNKLVCTIDFLLGAIKAGLANPWPSGGLLDDDPAILKAVDRLLQAAGYTTKTYCSAEAFLSEHDASTPGCLVLDLAMPGLNGLAVQQALALRCIDRPIIFLTLTGQGTIPDSVLAMRAGAIDFLTKPVDKSDLMSAIKSAEERDKTQRPIEARRKIVIQSVAKLSRRERQVLALIVTGAVIWLATIWFYFADARVFLPKWRMW